MAEPTNRSRYDIKENRFCQRIAASVSHHLNDLLGAYAWEREAGELLSQMCAAAEQILLHPVLESLSEKQEERVEIASLAEIVPFVRTSSVSLS